MAKSLTERLASAKATGRITITDLERLISDLSDERAAQDAAFVRHSAASIDFALSELDRDRAAQDADRARRAVQGLAPEIADLRAKLAARRADEAESVTTAERRAAIAERDALAATITTRYDEASRILIDLAKEIAASDAHLIASGLGRELSAEAVARGCENNFRMQLEPMTRLTQIRLPKLAALGDLWPEPEPNIRAGLGTWSPPRQPTAEELEARRLADEAQWARYKVIPARWPGYTIGPINHRSGIHLFTTMKGAELELTAALVTVAEKLNLIVTPISDSELAA